MQTRLEESLFYPMLTLSMASQAISIHAHNKVLFSILIYFDLDICCKIHKLWAVFCFKSYHVTKYTSFTSFAIIMNSQYTNLTP